MIKLMIVACLHDVQAKWMLTSNYCCIHPKWWSVKRVEETSFSIQTKIFTSSLTCRRRSALQRMLLLHVKLSISNNNVCFVILAMF